MERGSRIEIVDAFFSQLKAYIEVRHIHPVFILIPTVQIHVSTAHVTNTVL